MIFIISKQSKIYKVSYDQFKKHSRWIQSLQFDSDENVYKEIDLLSIDDTLIHVIIQFIQDTNSLPPMNVNELIELIKAAEFLQMESLITLLIEKLYKIFHGKNGLEIKTILQSSSNSLIQS